jgi:lipopolysaccharide biosynthesis regulator YciM
VSGVEAGVDAGRVAQLRVEHEAGARRGSGYRVTDTTVLTAAHVVAGNKKVQVVFNADLPDEWSVLATVALYVSAGDVAVLTIDPPEAQRGVEPTQYGQIGRRPAVLACRAVGFPRFKLRFDDQQAGVDPSATVSPYRDVHQVDGTIASLSNWREGTLEITVAPPDRDPDPACSPWEGMSGAAVWCADRIVGVVSRHHRNEGLNRLAGVRVSRWYDQLDADQRAQLQALIALPPVVTQLVDVIPREPAHLLAAAYTEYVEDIAPQVLLDREQELAELTAFCAGDEFCAWWRAGPWAGKTALASWFALHPPIGVTVVPFFITRRLAGQADSNAFTDAVIEQLRLVVGEVDLRIESPAARDGHRRRLLRKAASQAAAAGERLLLLVDGLDEDEGVPPAGPSSIAALLPRRPIEGLRVLVTSRPHPGLPHDLPEDHPLRHLRSDQPLTSRRPRELAPSELGEELKVLAKEELVRHLRGTDKLNIDVIGYIAAAGGGLTEAELGELTNATFVDLHGRLGGVLGRSLSSRALTDVPFQRAGPVYLFAHETLRELADAELGYDLQHYRNHLHQWGESYQQRGWPAETPRYLGRPYSRLLTRTRDLSRLVKLITQAARHDWMLASTLTDSDALGEILDTQQILLDSTVPDLTALGGIAIERYRLSVRNRSLPVQLPALWVRLGQPDRAEQLARSISDPDHQGRALAKVAEALAAERPDRAEQLALSFSFWRSTALAAAARGWTAAGQPDRAEQLAALLDPSSDQWALAEIAGMWVEAGYLERAEQLAGGIRLLKWRAEALTKVAAGWVAAGQLDRAEQLARGITDPYSQAVALTEVATAMVTAGQRGRAERLVAVAERLARSIGKPYWQASALTAVTAGWIKVHQFRRAAQLPEIAEQPAREITDPYRQAEALTEVAHGWLAAGELDRAEQLARSIADAGLQAIALTEVTTALAAAGQLDRAEQLARGITNPDRQADALADVATALVAVRQFDRAEQLARDADQLPPTLSVLDAKPVARVAAALVAVEQPDRAGQLVHSIVDPNRKAAALTDMATALVEAGERDRAEQTVEMAERLARGITDPDQRDWALAKVVTASVAAGRLDQAEQLAGRITDSYGRERAMTEIEKAWIAFGDLDRAQQVAGDTSPAWREQALIKVVAASVAAGRLDQAEQLAGRITDLHLRKRAMTGIATAWIGIGDLDRAQQVAGDTSAAWREQALTGLVKARVVAGQLDEAEQIARSISDPILRAWALTEVATALVAAGQLDRAELLPGITEQLDQAERQARKITDPAQQALALASVTMGLAMVGHLDRAERLAHTITNPGLQAAAMTKVATALVAAGQLDRAEQLAGSADELPRGISLSILVAGGDSANGGALAQVAKALVAAGHPDRAERVARSISDRNRQADALTEVATALVEAGLLDRAEQLARIAHKLPGGLGPLFKPTALVKVAKALVAAEHPDRAEQLARSLPAGNLQERVLTEVAAALAENGTEPARGRSRRILAALLTTNSWDAAMPILAVVAPAAVTPVAAALLDAVGPVAENGLRDSAEVD